MRNKLFKSVLCVACVIAACSVSNLYAGDKPSVSIYDFVVKDADSTDFALSQLKGKVVLIVNTATHCGFTPQYEGLQALYEKYASRGLVIIDFPCNQFRSQAPGTNKQIREFCQQKYHTTFPLMAKIDVNGENAHPLYVYLKSCKGDGKDVRWNFEKFLISRDGKVVERFGTQVKPEDIEQAVVECLGL